MIRRVSSGSEERGAVGKWLLAGITAVALLSTGFVVSAVSNEAERARPLVVPGARHEQPRERQGPPKAARRRGPDLEMDRRVQGERAFGAEGIVTRTIACPEFERQPSVYALGSSTMARPLGPLLKKALGAWNITVRRWGVQSSGLARPDYHDWPAEARKLVRQYHPDIFIVSLGTNDNQGLRVGKTWVRPADPRWEVIYGERVDELLSILSGEDREHPVIWLGPTALGSKRARKLGPRITRIMREHIEAFDGPAYFIDVYSRTLDSEGEILENLRLPRSMERVDARRSDDVHLTSEAVQKLMVEPVMRLLGGCLASSSC